MIIFKPLDVSFYEKAQQYLSASRYLSCEACFGDQIGWGTAMGSTYAESDGFYVLKYSQQSDKISFSAPMGAGNLKSLVVNLKEYAGDKKIEFLCATDKFLMMLDDAGIEYDKEPVRDRFDYIYTAEKLAYLSGKKLHGKRNHLNRFKSMYDYRFEEIDAGNLEIAEQINYRWCEKSGICKERSETNEFCAFRSVAKHFDRIAARGIILYVDGQPIGYTLGSPLYRGSDTFVVHFEKIATDHEGAYAAINNFFADLLKDEYKYLNREDDMGIEGLRRAKLSYYPDILLEKFTVRL